MRQSMGWGKEQAIAEEKVPTGIDEQLLERFFLYTESDDIHIQRGGLRSLLECTESSCMAQHWLPDSLVDSIYTKYATNNGIGLWEFTRIASDGLLLKGRLEEYEKAFAAIDEDGDGVLTWEELNQLFPGLGDPAEFDRILDDAGLPSRRGLLLGFDGIDFADFLSLARTGLDFDKALENLFTKRSLLSKLSADLASQPLAPDGSLGTVTTVHSKTEIDAIVASGADVVVELCFTWCTACDGFWPEYTNFAKDNSSTRFLKIVGNENESTGQYAEELMKMGDRIAPLFAAYSKGKLVIMWSGANKDRFISTMEEFHRIAGQKSVGHLNPQYVSSQGRMPIASKEAPGQLEDAAKKTMQRANAVAGCGQPESPPHMVCSGNKCVIVRPKKGQPERQPSQSEKDELASCYAELTMIEDMLKKAIDEPPSDANTALILELSRLRVDLGAKVATSCSA